MARCPRRFTCAPAVGVTALLFFSSPAAAQTDEELAKQYFKLGEAMYNRSDYQGALTQFQHSYDLSKKPGLLFNIARCYESLGQHEKAIDAYTKYLASNPENREAIESRIRNLRKLVPKSGAPPASRETVSTQRIAEPSNKPLREPTDTGTRSRPLRLTGWILIGTGAALVAAAVATGVMAKSKASDVEAAGTAGLEWSQVKNTYDQGGTLEKVSIATAVLGGVAAVTGAVLVVLDWRARRSEQRAWLAPGFTPGGATLSAGVRF